MNEVFISVNKIIEIAQNICSQEISEGKPVLTTLVNRIQYVTVSYSSTEGIYNWVDAFELVPVDSYGGNAVTYSDHRYLVATAQRERGYEGVIVNYKGYKHVLTRPVTFKPDGTELIQLSLF